MIKRRCTIALFAATFAALGGSNASAADYVGQTAPNTATGTGCVAPANCTFFQSADSAGQYAVQHAGVLTSFYVQEPTSMPAGDQVQLKVFRPGLGGTWTIVGESAVESLPAASNLPSYGARIKVDVGDRIGFSVSYASNMAWQTSAASTSTVSTVTGGNTAVGTTLQPSDISSANSLRLNLGAYVEPDADGDGFGDETQDLCPGNPSRGDTPCSGVLAGSKFANRYESSAGCTAATCIAYDRTLGANPAGSPIDGVVVRFRAGYRWGGSTLRWSVLRPEGVDVRLIAQSPDVDSGINPTGIVVSGPVRIPIAAGDLIGFSSDDHDPNPALRTSNLALYSAPGAGTAYLIDPGDGNPGMAIGELRSPTETWTNSEFAIGADVEPDADHDGYGDETQDGCPTDASSHGACPAAVVAPKITGLKLSPNTFRVNPKGATISRRAAHKGSSIKLTLSASANVTFVVSQLKSGRMNGKRCKAPTRKTKRAKKCTYAKIVFTFMRELPAGASKLAFSGRYRIHRKSRSLRTGKYRLEAAPTLRPPGVKVSTGKASFRIVRR